MTDQGAQHFAFGQNWRRYLAPLDLAVRLARSYETRAEALLRDAASMANMGDDFGAGLYEREVAYLVRQEWAETSEDILWRRGKLGLHAPDSTASALEQWLADAGENYRMSAAL